MSSLVAIDCEKYTSEDMEKVVADFNVQYQHSLW